jgi:hypothetical protein
VQVLGGPEILVEHAFMKWQPKNRKLILRYHKSSRVTVNGSSEAEANEGGYCRIVLEAGDR